MTKTALCSVWAIYSQKYITDYENKMVLFYHIPIWDFEFWSLEFI